MKFTKANVARLELPAGKTDFIVFDAETAGFGVRLRAGGKRSWVAQMRINGRTRRLSIGDVGRIELDVARTAAKRFFAQSVLGTDPIKARAEARARAATTVGPTIELYLTARESALRASSFKQTRRYLREYFAELHELPVSLVTRRDVAAAVAKIAAEHGRVAAARARSALSGFFSWALREGIAGENNPVEHTNDPAPDEKPRERTLAPHELRALWHALPNTEFGTITKLLLFTACRRSEIGCLAWSEVDLDKALLTISADRMKGGREHRLPLVPEAVELLRQVPRRAGNSFVFGASRKGFSGFSGPVDELRRALAATGAIIEPWALHDLRRSVRTQLGELEVDPWVAERILSHARHGIEATYDWSRLEKPMRVALLKWSDRLRSIIEDTEQTVVQLRA